MRWFFGLNCPVGPGRKGPRRIFYWPRNKGARAEFSSFGALGECAYFHYAFTNNTHFHSTPSLITPIFIPRLLLRHVFSFPAFSYDVYFHSPPSPIALNFISRILLIRVFSLCKYPHKLSQCLEQVEPFPLPSLVGGASTLPRLQNPTLPVKLAVWGMKDVRG